VPLQDVPHPLSLEAVSEEARRRAEHTEPPAA
jgi:hypothetical protein